MSRLSIVTPSQGEKVMQTLYREMENRIAASPPDVCPVDMALAFLRLCHAQTCGKCVPCRIGLGQLTILIEKILDGEATSKDLELIETTATVIEATADCAIGYEAARMVLQGLRGFREDYESHINTGRCLSQHQLPVPCVAMCPADIDIPGYIALVEAKRYDDAMALIRNDNPFPTVCGYVCEHPCEAHCRRGMIDDAINICGIKRFAADNSTLNQAPAPAAATGKKIGIVGGGPCGLTAAYYLTLMGHSVTVYDQRPALGGMLRYGIPRYRLPQEQLDADINYILSAGVQVKLNTSIGKDLEFAAVEQDYDALYIAIGAHNDKKLGIEGEDSIGVLSAVQMLRDLGEGHPVDLSNKRVCIIGGGNVAMDASRTALRLGAASVTCVYRRRINDMTALEEEVGEAIAEGCQILPLQAPSRIEHDVTGHVTALWTKPQIIGEYGSGDRPKPYNAQGPEFRLECDVIIVSIGQSIDARPFEQVLPIEHGTINALNNTFIPNSTKVFAGGDAVTGPATVIRAVAAGKVAAANIDSYLGFHHIITTDIEIPAPHLTNSPACGRVNLRNHFDKDQICSFALAKDGMSQEEVIQETARCLRCDHFGYGIFKGGRKQQW